MANDHLFATVENVKIFFCIIPNKYLVFGNFYCLGQALIINILLRNFLFFPSRFRMTFPIVTACQVMRPVC